ncbi:MAG: hypothetical protein ACKVQU_29545 [Burkholderiales bacterium]
MAPKPEFPVHGSEYRRLADPMTWVEWTPIQLDSLAPVVHISLGRDAKAIEKCIEIKVRDAIRSRHGGHRGLICRLRNRAQLLDADDSITRRHADNARQAPRRKRCIVAFVADHTVCLRDSPGVEDAGVDLHYAVIESFRKAVEHSLHCAFRFFIVCQVQRIQKVHAIAGFSDNGIGPAIAAQELEAFAGSCSCGFELRIGCTGVLGANRIEVE